jgi:hypothetical protein
LAAVAVVLLLPSPPPTFPSPVFIASSGGPPPPLPAFLRLQLISSSSNALLPRLPCVHATRTPHPTRSIEQENAKRSVRFSGVTPGDRVSAF